MRALFCNAAENEQELLPSNIKMRIAREHSKSARQINGGRFALFC
jgi:hypothetical protein